MRTGEKQRGTVRVRLFSGPHACVGAVAALLLSGCAGSSVLAGDGETREEAPDPCFCTAPAVTGRELTVSLPAGGAGMPSVAWTGSELGVAWNDGREGEGASEIYFARIGPDGSMLGGEVRATHAPGDSIMPSLAWTGSAFGVAWCDERDESEGREIYFVRIGPDGAPHGSEVRVTEVPGLAESPSLVWTGSGFAVAWDEWREDDHPEIFLALLTAEGSLTGPDVRVMEGVSARFPVLAWTGSELGAAWEDSRRGDGTVDVFFRRFSAGGEPIGPEVDATDQVDVSSYNPAMGWTGSEFGLVWEDGRDGEGNMEIFFARLSPAGEKMGPDVRVTDTEGSQDIFLSHQSIWPSIAWTGCEYGIFWNHYWSGSMDLRFVRLSPEGAPAGADIEVTAEAGSVHYSGGSLALGAGRASAAWTGGGYGAAWTREEGDYGVFSTQIVCR